MNQKDKGATGIVSSRRCPTCGHHEVGFLTEDGRFHPFRAGARVTVQEESPATPLPERPEEAIQAPQPRRPWVPEPLRGERTLRLKYGVFFTGETGSVEGGIYRTAYLEKLAGLIEKEVFVPVAVILDRFFTAPHLASGNPAEIASAMWEDLEEVREPVLRMAEWLERPSKQTLRGLGTQDTREDKGEGPVDDESLARELNELTLEEFLSLL